MAYNPNILDGVPVLSALQMHRAAEYAIAEIMVDGKVSASFAGASYSKSNINDLKALSDRYYQMAVNAGEIILNPYHSPTVSDISFTE